MPRLVIPIVFVALVGGLFLLPRPDPVRLAATQAGGLLREPARLAPEMDWRAALGPGDLVETPDGRRADVRTVEAGGLRLAPRDGSEEIVVAAAEIPRLVERRPLWRYLTAGSAATTTDGVVQVRVRGYRMQLDNTAYRDHRLHARLFESVERSLRAIAAEEGFEVRVAQRLRADYEGAFLLCSFVERGLALEVHLPDGTAVGASTEWYPPDGRSLIPPVLAILLAMLLRRPLLALALGVLVGSVLERMMFGASLLGSLASGGGRVFTHYLGGELLEPTRQQIALFLLFMLAMVGVVTRAGGLRGLMERMARLASSARRSQAATFLAGMCVFFDHLANTVLVGTTMRPLTDRFRVSREKLAYLVDSTAAPVAGISIFSTWIAFEVSTFSAHLPEAGMAASQGYAVFLQTLPYRFYSLLTLFFVGLIVFTGRDFGPMLRAERRARRGKLLRDGARLLTGGARGLEPDASITPRARMALVPLATFVLATLLAVLVRGGAFAGLGWGPGGGAAAGAPETLAGDGLIGVLFRGSGAWSLMAGALAGLVAAILTALPVASAGEIARGAWAGVRSMGVGLALLCLAWMIGAVCRDLGTATYLCVMLQESINPLLLPILLFALSGLLAFATGSPWSTMTILLPLVVGLSFEAGQSTPIGGQGMVIIAIGAVLEGAIFGDHCSPISDTTVMSSVACSSDHVDHVRTQTPYAVLTMTVALLAGYFPAVIVGLSPLLSLLLGAATLTAFVLLYGKRVDEVQEPEARPVEPIGAAGFQE